MPVKTVNIKAGYPTAEQAMQRLSQELRIAKANRLRALKVIHGYGSTGSGGAIRTAARRLLSERRARGQIRAYIPGEEFNAFSVSARSAVSAAPELKRDIDYGRQNDGITIVLL
ncbi:MAG: Smr/MutS family protein [Provencibacterium sp.]|nr:Smr/MutS family protein [Provencibacterium sp.]